MFAQFLAVLLLTSLLVEKGLLFQTRSAAVAKSVVYIGGLATSVGGHGGQQGRRELGLLMCGDCGRATPERVFEQRRLELEVLVRPLTIGQQELEGTRALRNWGVVFFVVIIVFVEEGIVSFRIIFRLVTVVSSRA